MAGIIDTFKLAGTLILAIPAALAGLELLFVRDQPFFGGILIVLAVVLVLAQHYVTLPSDVPGLVAKRATDRVVGDSDSDSDSNSNSDEIEVEPLETESDSKSK